MVKIIGIIGSPRSGGNTETYVKKALKSAADSGADTDIIHLGKVKIKPCNACDICKFTGECPIDDDMPEISEKVKEADGLIIGSPVYFGNVTAQTKLFMDRSRPLRIDFKLKDKVAGGISVGASRNGGQETTITAIHQFFFIQDMLVVGDGAPLGHYGGAGVSGAAGDAEEDEVGLDTSANLGKRVAELALKLNSDS